MRDGLAWYLIVIGAAAAIPLTRGWVLHDMRSEFDDEKPWWMMFLPTRHAWSMRQTVLMYIVPFSTLAPALAATLSAGSFLIGAAWAVLAWHRHQQFESVNQHLSLSEVERSALARARIIGFVGAGGTLLILLALP